MKRLLMGGLLMSHACFGAREVVVNSELPLGRVFVEKLTHDEEKFFEYLHERLLTSFNTVTALMTDCLGEQYEKIREGDSDLEEQQEMDDLVFNNQAFHYSRMLISFEQNMNDFARNIRYSMYSLVHLPFPWFSGSKFSNRSQRCGVLNDSLLEIEMGVKKLKDFYDNHLRAQPDHVYSHDVIQTVKGYADRFRALYINEEDGVPPFCNHALDNIEKYNISMILKLMAIELTELIHDQSEDRFARNVESCCSRHACTAADIYYDKTLLALYDREVENDHDIIAFDDFCASRGFSQESLRDESKFWFDGTLLGSIFFDGNDDKQVALVNLFLEAIETKWIEKMFHAQDKILTRLVDQKFSAAPHLEPATPL